MEGKGLWLRVLKSLYENIDVGESGLITKGSWSRVSNWWKYIIDNVSGVGRKWL